MRFSPLTCCVALILAKAPAHATEEGAKAIIRGAIKACGGPTGGEVEAISVRYAVKISTENVCELHAAGNADGSLAMIAIRDQQLKMKTLAVLKNGELRTTNLETGAKDRRGNDRELEYLNHERALWLLPLLHDQRYQLSKPTEKKAKDGALLQVIARFEKQQELQLFFDKATKRLHSAETTFLRDQRIRHEFSRYAVRKWLVAEEKAVGAAGQPTEGPELLSYLRGQIPDETRAAEVRRAIANLADSSFIVREKAGAFLKRHGQVAMPLLKAATAGTSLETMRRVNRLILEIGQGFEIRRLAIRLIGYKRPEQADQVLRSFRSHAVDEQELREIDMALATIANQPGSKGKEEGKRPQLVHRVFLKDFQVAHRIRRQWGDIGVDLELIDLELFSHLDEAMLSMWTSDHAQPLAGR